MGAPLSTCNVYPNSCPRGNGVWGLPPCLGGRLCLEGWEMSRGVRAPFTLPVGYLGNCPWTSLAQASGS